MLPLRQIGKAPRGSFELRLSGYPSAFVRVLAATAVFGSAQFAGSLFTLQAPQLLIPRLGTSGGASLAIAGYFLYNLMATGVSYPAGAIADGGGHKRPALLAFSFPSFAAGAAFIAFSSITLLALVPVFIFGGTAAGAVEVAETALAGDQLPARQRGSGFGLLAAVNGVGDFVASIWVSLVWTISSASLAFVGAALAVVGALPAARIPSTPDAGKIGQPQVAP